MKHSDQQIAARLVLVDAPKLSTQAVAKYLDVKSVTLRSWITREYIKLINAERGSSGRGKSSLFSPLDVAQLIICAKMTRFSIVPGFLTAKFAEEVTGNVLDVLHILAGTKNYEQEKRDSTAQYYDRRIDDQKKRGFTGESIKILEDLKEEALSKDAVLRYYSIYYSPLMKEFMGGPTESGLPPGVGGMGTEPVILVFDCLDVAEKLIALYRESRSI